MKKLFVLMFFSVMTSPACAVDGVFAEYGLGNMAEMHRVGGLWKWDRSWLNDGDWQLTGFWEASLGSWRGHSAAGNNQTVADVGITPVFRLQQKSPAGFSPYAEAAIGLHLITPTFVNANRQLGSAVQFGDHVGIGVRFGVRQQFDLGYRYQHLSNGGVKKPNQGINFSQVRFAYHF